MYSSNKMRATHKQKLKQNTKIDSPANNTTVRTMRMRESKQTNYDTADCLKKNLAKICEYCRNVNLPAAQSAAGNKFVSRCIRIC